MHGKSPLNKPQIRGVGEAKRKAYSDMLTESQGPHNKVDESYIVGLKAFLPYPLIAFLVGVGIASIFSGAHALALLLVLFACAILFVGTLYRRQLTFGLALLLVFCALGIFRYMLWESIPRDSSMETRTDSVVTIAGVVADEPDRREGNVHLTVRVLTIDGISTATSTVSKVLVFAPHYPEYQYGDALTVKGKLARPKKFAEEDGRAFDYPAYLASKGIHYQIFFPNIERTGEDQGSRILASLFSIKHAFQYQLGQYFPEPHNALLGGLLLGGKQSLGEEWLERFRTAGIIHIVVLSGYNMTIVAEWLVVCFRFLGFYGSLSMGGVGIVLFALMTGAGATVVRAAVMALIALLARATGRTYTMGRALLLAGVCMVLQNPSILANDPSFQLSFLASLGLIFVSPVVERRTKIFAQSRILREVFVSTVATQVMVLPLLLYQTGVFSIVALVANMLVLPVIPLTMLFGFLAGAFGFVFAPLAVATSFLGHVLLSWILLVARMLTSVPFATVDAPLSATLVLVLYILLALLLWYAHRSIVRDDRVQAPR